MVYPLPAFLPTRYSTTSGRPWLFARSCCVVNWPAPASDADADGAGQLLKADAGAISTLVVSVTRVAIPTLAFILVSSRDDVDLPHRHEGPLSQCATPI